MARTLQCVADLGLRASVFVIHSATASSSTVRGLPLRISSYSPSIRSLMKRLRHLPIVWGPTPSRVATTMLLGSRSQASTIFARNVSAADSERDRVIAKRCVRSPLDIVSIALGRPVRIGYLPQSRYPKPMQELCYELMGRDTRYVWVLSSRAWRVMAGLVPACLGHARPSLCDKVLARGP